MRSGRISISYDANIDAEPTVLVVPDDGSEPIHLRVSELEIDATTGDAARLTGVMFLHSLHIEDAHGNRVKAEPNGHPVIFPDLEITEPDVDERERHLVGRVRWFWSADRRGRYLTNPLSLFKVRLPE